MYEQKMEENEMQRMQREEVLALMDELVEILPSIDAPGTIMHADKEKFNGGLSVFFTLT